VSLAAAGRTPEIGHIKHRFPELTWKQLGLGEPAGDREARREAEDKVTPTRKADGGTHFGKSKTDLDWRT